ncbi:Protein of unknown function DUF1616 [Haloterrigena turkmenica DSM 5511]|uniref:DUF1616 domain-containing protein n=1 Tax=Haloterrigena turkmenica (strain ATCC 51198 / DSM 5511 / JCM 9101 / NCIMB 13204 / VKM B-1734 / 4k) TaxID=543526 RepID=D2RP69_HALTV|nr:DUF1616 domain-containing protein [Haloterrigena turkmenica]ADB60103.1 Protein of unknown function DUF1616 [Haloterrigena turkmenica DSM 5511]
MTETRSLVALLPRPVRTLPADLAAVFALVVLTNVAALAPVLRETSLRVPLGLAFVLFVPGYAFIAALFPEAGDEPTADPPSDVDGGEEPTEGTDGGPLPVGSFLDDRSGIDGIERVALSFGLSIAVTPLIGLVLNFTPWGIRLVPIMLAVSAFTVGATVVAAVRRRELPEDERFRVPYRAWYAAGRAELLEPDTRADAALNVVLVLSLLLAVGTVGYAVAVPPDGEQFSAVYILTEDDDGELTADNYPTEFTQGESQELVLGVDNHEHRTVDYTVVLVEQRVSVEDNETTVEEQRELDRFETQLDHNESWHHPHEVEPTMTGENVRLVWLLYPGGDVPEEPSTETTEYHAHLWVNVTEE